MGFKKGDGAEFVRQNYKVEPSELGANVADLLTFWVGGIYHLSPRLLEKVNWAETYFIRMTYEGSELATFDFASLSRLVFFAHHYGIRISVGPKNFRCLEMMFHQRKQRDGGMCNRHPTLEDAVAAFREAYPKEEEFIGEPTVLAVPVPFVADAR